MMCFNICEIKKYLTSVITITAIFTHSNQVLRMIFCAFLQWMFLYIFELSSLLVMMFSVFQLLYYQQKHKNNHLFLVKNAFRNESLHKHVVCEGFGNTWTPNQTFYTLLKTMLTDWPHFSCSSRLGKSWRGLDKVGSHENYHVMPK